MQENNLVNKEVRKVNPNEIGSKTIFGTLKGITFEVQDVLDDSANGGESMFVDFVTLKIDVKEDEDDVYNSFYVFVYPYNATFSLDNLPDFFRKLNEMLLDESKFPSIKMVVRKYGTFLFAFDYDLFNAVLEVKEYE